MLYYKGLFDTLEDVQEEMSSLSFESWFYNEGVLVASFEEPINNEKLVEISEEEYINVIKSGEPENPLDRIEQLEAENAMLKVQNKVLADKADFHEEVLTEIILAMYS